MDVIWEKILKFQILLNANHPLKNKQKFANFSLVEIYFNISS
jgi:hypothetical protein